MPTWKKRKDPLLSKIIYRPISFYLSSWAVRASLTGNDVSYISAVLAIVAIVAFCIPGRWPAIAGGILVNVWLLLDCTDGNMARSQKKLAFGDFSDAISSYLLVGLLGPALGLSVYMNGGALLAPSQPWIIFLGAIASSSDTLMRLIYQKYKNTELHLVSKGVLHLEADVREDHTQVGDFRVRVEAEFGIGGVLPLLILIGAIANALDLVILYCLIYYAGSAIVAVLIYVRRARSREKEI